MYEYLHAKFSKIKLVILACNIFTTYKLFPYCYFQQFEELVALCILLQWQVSQIQIEHGKVYPLLTIFLLSCTLVCKKKQIMQVWSYDFMLTVTA